jgi:NAD-dependent SIR2 family protein deacetylase
MSALTNNIEPISSAIDKFTEISWCYIDKHNQYEFYPDFNEWLNGEEGLDIRIRNKVEGLANPSKAFFASDYQSYNQAFQEFRNERMSEVLGEEYIQNLFGGTHWFERNVDRFNQLINCLVDHSVVPFVGAGLSVECGFPTWKHHLEQQGKTAGINATHVQDLIRKGQYEVVIEEIENRRTRDVFIQEIRDVFSKTGRITETTLRLTELFTDTLITTNYDHIIEQAFNNGEKNKLQILDSGNILQLPDEEKITIIHLHGDVQKAAGCILSKKQYDDAYGSGKLDLNKEVPKLLSYHYRNSSLLFLGCSLNHDRTMQVFQAVKDSLGDVDRPQHFSLESMPEDEATLADRNAYLLKFGITPIWFPKSSYDYVEQILRLARNEMRYQGCAPGKRKEALQENLELAPVKETRGILAILNRVVNFIQHL